ncbi:hypothetical protein VULLAG_LOCUS12545 [Vulpes lagopus]
MSGLSCTDTTAFSVGVWSGGHLHGRRLQKSATVWQGIQMAILMHPRAHRAGPPAPACGLHAGRPRVQVQVGGSQAFAALGVGRRPLVTKVPKRQLSTRAGCRLCREQGRLKLDPEQDSSGSTRVRGCGGTRQNPGLQSPGALCSGRCLAAVQAPCTQSGPPSAILGTGCPPTGPGLHTRVPSSGGKVWAPGHSGARQQRPVLPLGAPPRLPLPSLQGPRETGFILTLSGWWVCGVVC